MTKRVLIIEENAGVRSDLSNFFSLDKSFSVASAVGQASDAIDAFRSDRPDLILMNAHLPESSGFEILQQFGLHETPLVIFLAGDGDPSVPLFNANRIAYLRIPLIYANFEQVISQVKEEFAQGKVKPDASWIQAVSTLLEQRPAAKLPGRLQIRSSDRVTTLQTDQIDWVQAADNYVEIHSGTQTLLMRETLTNMAKKLQPHYFLRIHRSRLVNTARIQALKPLFHGEYEVILKDGTRLTSSRQYRQTLQRLTGEAVDQEMK